MTCEFSITQKKNLANRRFFVKRKVDNNVDNVDNVEKNKEI